MKQPLAVKQTTMNTVVHAAKHRRTLAPFGVSHTPDKTAVLIHELMMMQTAIRPMNPPKYERILQPFCSSDEQTETVVSSKRKAMSSPDTYPAFQPERNCPLPRSLVARQKIERAIR
jgi:hypothetical protein